MVITIEEAREQCEVIGTSQDSRLLRCIKAAEAFASQYMNRPLEPWEEADSDSSEEPMPDDVRLGILMYVATYYGQRESIIVGTIVAQNPAANIIFDLYRREMGA